MSQTLTGTVHGNTNVLDAPPSFPEGQSVEVVIRSSATSSPAANANATENGPPEWWTPEDDQILDEIHRARKQGRRPQF